MRNISDWAIAVEYASPPHIQCYQANDGDQSAIHCLEPITSFVERGASLSSAKLRDVTNDPERNYADLLLPAPLYALPPRDRMAVAWACEAHNALQSELATIHQKRRQMLFAARNFELLAEEADMALQSELATIHQKRRQMLFSARNFELLAEETDMKLQSVKQQVDMLIRVALDQVSAPKVAQEQRLSYMDQEIPRCFGGHMFDV